MKLGMRTKLIIAFVLVVIGPIANTFIMMAMAITKLNHDPEIVKFNSLNKNFQRVISNVEENFKIIDDYDAFDGILRPILEEFDGSVRVMDATGDLLYDSRGSKDGLMDDSLGADAGLFSLTRYSYSTEIENGDEIAGKIIIDYDINLMPTQIARKVSYHFRLSYILGLGSIFLFISLFTRIISRSVLVPLNELNSATRSIAKGDLDFVIKYKRNNELGRFCQAFDMMRDKLKASIDQRIASERRQKEMIGVISHDLRTPISSIKGYVEALQDGMAHDEEQFQRYLKVIHDKTHRLDALIDDLFQFSQMELGNLKMNLEIMDSSVMLEGIINSVSVDWRGGTTETVIKRPFPSVQIRVDAKRIAQVMDNIMQNAIKYGGDFGVIEVMAAVVDDHLVISVSDNGIGIAVGDLPHIFELFYRGEKSRSRNYGGTGLGLTICKNIVEQHGGKIWAESVLGEGTTISFTLPMV
ncbi:MAG TPA: ATP-binding protein [Clostridia bacterium]|nr:ATP-binding protein [Clostridia bacterium]